MTKLRDAPVTSDDLQEYLDGCSDFSFELATLKQVYELGYEVEHGGFYEDPATNKSRQFDIRASQVKEPCAVWLTIECKNIRENNPLLVSCVPRKEVESYHSVAHVRDLVARFQSAGAIHLSRAEVIPFADDRSIYKVGGLVGKSIAQVGKSAGKDNPIVASDSDVFDRWSQALASAADLVRNVYLADTTATGFFAGIVPILVVPDGRLWLAEYDDNGSQKDKPRTTDRCSFFVGRSYQMHHDSVQQYLISHLEIVTRTGLKNLLTNVVAPEMRAQNFFPRNSLSTRLGV